MRKTGLLILLPTLLLSGCNKNKDQKSVHEQAKEYFISNATYREPNDYGYMVYSYGFVQGSYSSEYQDYYIYYSEMRDIFRFTFGYGYVESNVDHYGNIQIDFKWGNFKNGDFDFYYGVNMNTDYTLHFTNIVWTSSSTVDTDASSYNVTYNKYSITSHASSAHSAMTLLNQGIIQFDSFCVSHNLPSYR